MHPTYQASTHRQISLHDGWELISVAPGSYQNPEQLASETTRWLAASVPGTVMQALQRHQPWDFNAPPNADEHDWWYRCTFAAPASMEGKHYTLAFEGLATVADVWLNGKLILQAENMFRAYEVDVTPLLTERNELHLHFHSLAALLAQKRPRPRWRTNLVEQQQLRWFRTTLLGKIPGWSPPVQAVGPWRPISLVERSTLVIEHLHIRPKVQENTGVVSLDLRARSLDGDVPSRVTLRLGETTVALQVQTDTPSTFALTGEARLNDVALWWPHTHGQQPRYPASIQLYYPDTVVEIDCGSLAFRTLELCTAQEGFSLHVNGATIFCRGACWTPLNMVTLTASPQEYREALLTIKNAGMNMIRVGGTMVYEDEAFYTLCDELGILVWQDFMFANMEYPVTQEDFLANVQAECKQVLQRLQRHASLVLLCGNSEIAQQVAMLGLPEERWSNAFFDQLLPELCQSYTDAPYWSSTPNGGALPFQVNAGTSNYQGVGAYLRPLEDARQSGVRFATECLSFANIPEDQTLDLFLKPNQSPVHHPRWKARVPRDNGPGWDFDDIRDYYLEKLFRVEPMKLRYADMQRYLALGRVTTGEVMASVFAEWRRQRSSCQGGLIWFYRDLWPGAGWGVVDSTGYPKAPYYYLRRILAPTTCFFTDEGLSGLSLHLVNDTEYNIPAVVQLTRYRLPGTLLETANAEILLPACSAQELHAEKLFGHFLDLTYAFRFGPPGQDLVVATLSAQETGQVLGEAFYFPHQGLPNTREQSVGLQAHARPLEDGSYELHIKTEQFAQSVAIRANQYLPEENYFHMRPGSEKIVRLVPMGKKSSLWGSLSALNSMNDININIYKGTASG
ncbi:glycoside hydrolase family 2 protein [Ktedonobacter racemifer]|uniref:beta-mannosidase n=1 Tax=Ktedonobacter racemifer DSM 44963 TaxID=485913 RepID=D6U593_KTERA|nr:sugar-binding domain-containing protein [Ktedonobacter racemifer]EFH81673.1 glycoside hydrolase family 2 sugar binding [Ktedonobacter racemifer DSM 44963]